MKPVKILGIDEVNSPAWRNVEAEIERRIESLHKYLENDLDMTETAETRGRIRELRRILMMSGKPKMDHRPSLNEVEQLPPIQRESYGL